MNHDMRGIVSAVEEDLYCIEGIAFLLVSNAGTCGAYSPTLGTIVGLAECAIVSGAICDESLQRARCIRDIPHSEKRRQEIANQVATAVAKLHENGAIQFGLLWNVDDEHEIHVDRSNGLSLEEMYEMIAKFLGDDVYSLRSVYRTEAAKS